MKCVERLPERQKIEAGTETAFCHHKERARVVGEAFIQLVPAEKDVASLFQTVVIREVDIIEISGNRCTLTVKFEVGRLYGVMFHVSYSCGKESEDLNDAGPMAQISA